MTLKEISDEINQTWTNCSSNHSSNSISLTLNLLSGIKLSIDYKDSEIPNINFYCKTCSWEYDGCRTDLHDVFSLIFSIFFKLNSKISCKIIHLSNCYGAPGVEIESAYGIAEQINPNLIGKINSQNVISAIKNLLIDLCIYEKLFWSVMGCPCDDCREAQGYDKIFSPEINKTIKAKIIEVFPETSTENNSFSRKLPTWEYYRDFKKDVTIIFSPRLAQFIRIFYEEKSSHFKTISSINGTLYLDKELKNYINNSSLNFVKSKLDKIEKGTKKNILILPLENVMIGLKEKYIIIKGTKSGIMQFKIEREKLRIRHNRETSVLFKPTIIKWSYKINADRFESLIKDLLEQEKGFSNVRKAGITNEGDNGRDLLAFFNKQIPPSESSQNSNQLISKKIKIVVQCKAYSKNVGKSDVRDIRDTIEFHKSDGYFLVVSSFVTNQLISHLENLSSKNEYIDWWTRDEIETRLKNNLDILIKYNDIVKNDEN